MTKRRQFLKTVPVAAAGLTIGVTAANAGTTAAGAAGATTKAAANAAPNVQRGPLDAPVVCNPVASGGVINVGTNGSFPNVMMVNQHGLGMSFYEGFIENKVVMMHFMSLKDEERFPATRFVKQVVDRLGDRVGRDIHVYSVTRDPENDTVSRLAAYAKELNAPKGWQFLTGSRNHCSDLAFRMYRMGHSSLPGPRNVDVVFYGNGTTGLWGAFPVHIQPDDAAQRVAWVIPGETLKPGQKMRRAGPRVFDPTDTRNHNREV